MSELACGFIRPNYRCDKNPAYLQFFASLPPFDRGQLAIPQGMHVLMYGPSFMRQLGQAVLCNNRTPRRVVSYSCDLSAVGTSSLHSRLIRRRRKASTADALTAVYAHNATLTVVTNCAGMQDISHMEHIQARLGQLDKAIGFTHVLYMSPHPPCFFNWVSHRHNRPCIDLTREERQTWACADVHRLFAPLVGRNVTFVPVADWARVDVNQTSAKLVPCVRGSGVGPALFLGPFLVESQLTCNIGDACSKRSGHPWGHQCQPGGVEPMAALAMRRLVLGPAASTAPAGIA